jgi:hypothetical protein
VGRRDKETPISVPELMKAAGSRLENAPELWDRYVQLKKNGGNARFTWSYSNGYRMHDGEGE